MLLWFIKTFLCSNCILLRAYMSFLFKLSSVFSFILPQWEPPVIIQLCLFSVFTETFKNGSLCLLMSLGYLHILIKQDVGVS